MTDLYKIDNKGRAVGRRQDETDKGFTGSNDS